MTRESWPWLLPVTDRMMVLILTSNCHSSKPNRASRFIEPEVPPHLYKPAPPPLILTDSTTCFRYSCLGDLSLLPQLLSAIPIASGASTVLARAGLRNLCNAEIRLGIAGQSGFWERLDATARSLNDYFVYFPVAERMSTSSTSW